MAFSRSIGRALRGGVASRRASVAVRATTASTRHHHQHRHHAALPLFPRLARGAANAASALPSFSARHPRVLASLAPSRGASHAPRAATAGTAASADDVAAATAAAAAQGDVVRALKQSKKDGADVSKADVDAAVAKLKELKATAEALADPEAAAKAAAKAAAADAAKAKPKAGAEVGVTPKSEDFSRWYLDVIRECELADYGPARGTMVIRPYGYALWEGIQSWMDAKFKATGVRERVLSAAHPVFVHHEGGVARGGFSPELAVVTQGGGKSWRSRSWCVRRPRRS